MTRAHTTRERWEALATAILNADGRPPCDPPNACDTCMLYDIPESGPAREAWLAMVRLQADEPIPLQPRHARRPKRGPGEFTPSDRRILGVLSSEHLATEVIADRLGMTPDAVRGAISEARRRGALIDSSYGRGYRLRQEQAG